MSTVTNGGGAGRRGWDGFQEMRVMPHMHYK
jgi:hypothetical protein